MVWIIFIFEWAIYLIDKMVNVIRPEIKLYLPLEQHFCNIIQ